MGLWWSGDHELLVTPTPLATGRPTNGEGFPILSSVCSCSPCVPVGEAGCALLGDIELKLNLTVLEIGVDRVEMLHPVKRRCKSCGNSSLDCKYTLGALPESPVSKRDS